MSFQRKSARFAASLVFALLCVSLQLQGQVISDACAGALKNVKDAAPGAAKDKALLNLIRPGRNAACYATIIAGQGLGKAEKAQFKSVLELFEASRTDKQAGSSTGTGGTTNLVSKGVAARILSFAAEHGALTESVSKNVVTVQGSLDGIPAVLIRQGLVPYCPESEPQTKSCLHQRAIDTLSRFLYSVSFDTGQGQTVTGTSSGAQQGTAQPVVFTAQQQQITQVMGKFLIIRSKESIASAKFKKDFKDAINSLKDDAGAGAALNKLWTGLINNSQSYANWEACTKKELDPIRDDNDELKTKWLPRAQQLVRILKGTSLFDSQCNEIDANDPRVETDLKDLAKNSANNPNIEQAATDALRALTAFAFTEEQFINSIIQKPVLTFEYDYNRPPGQPDNSTFKLIYGQGMGANWSVTANGSFNIFNSQPTVPGADRLAYTQAALEVDRNIHFLGPQTLSGAYYFQYQNSPGILNVSPGNPLPGVSFVNLPPTATQAFAQKGNIHIAQLKLSMGAGSSNVKFPVSVSYSNRTELITKPVWRGQIGVSYDLDALFAGAAGK